MNKPNSLRHLSAPGSGKVRIRYRLSGVLACLIPIILFFKVDALMSREMPNLKYAEVDGNELFLDLYLPEINIPSDGAPLIIYIHGGAWRAGSRSSVPVRKLVDFGYAIASVDYRLTPVAPFPANIHDLKASVRYLRSRAGDLGFNAGKITVIGSSAGGHLAALLGITSNDKILEGTVGGKSLQDYDSSIQGIVSFYGASNLETILSQSTPHGLSVREPALKLLLGGLPDAKPELARLASPVAHIDANDPPLLLIHGDQDPQMPVNQSLELVGHYRKHHLTVELEIVHGGKHGGPGFYEEDMIKKVDAFIRQNVLSPNQ